LNWVENSTTPWHLVSLENSMVTPLTTGFFLTYTSTWRELTLSCLDLSLVFFLTPVPKGPNRPCHWPWSRCHPQIQIPHILLSPSLWGGDKTPHRKKPLLVLFVTCSIPYLDLIIQHSRTLMIHSTVSSSICLLLLAVLIGSKPVLSNATSKVLGSIVMLWFFSLRKEPSGGLNPTRLLRYYFANILKKWQNAGPLLYQLSSMVNNRMACKLIHNHSSSKFIKQYFISNFSIWIAPILDVTVLWFIRQQTMFGLAFEELLVLFFCIFVQVIHKSTISSNYFVTILNNL
jgi:hypothetical protein